MIIAQITDPHVIGAGGLLDDYDPAAALAAVLVHLSRMNPRPDLVLLTGDLTNSGTPEEYEEFCRVTAGFDLPIAAIPGNHDSRTAFAAALADTCIRIGALPFLHFAIDAGDLRLIGLDTLGDDGEHGGRLCGTRLAWVDEQLGRDPGRPAIIFMHHPPFETGISFMDEIRCAGGDDFANIVRRHPQVAGILCGHVHRSVATGWAGTVATICPSIAYKVPLVLGEPGEPHLLPQDPGLQIHIWHPRNGLVTHTEYLPDDV